MSSTTHHFVIEPLRGVGPIRFGMHKDEVSRAFTYVYSSFFKTSTSQVRSDDCPVVGLIVHYDAGSRVDNIEIYRPQHGSVTLELFGRDITGISVRDAVALLSPHSTAPAKNEYGYDFPDLGLSTFNSHLQSEEQPVECFSLESPAPPEGA